MMQSRAAHDTGRAATLKANFQIGSSLSLEYSDALARPFQQIPSKHCVTRICRENLLRGRRVNEAELGLIRLCKIRRVSDQVGTLGY
jgi:hypothetical protein